jgi:OHCU decarboxylase
MRSDPRDYELVAPGNLQAVTALLARDPGEWLPIAGGTDVMVQYAAGKLQSRKLVSIWNLPELRNIEIHASEIRVGAGSTYTDMREHEFLSREFPLLARAARWTGGIANQNRGTLGGNIVNASPAADSLPALLVYDAELILISARGERRLPYVTFHTGYKKTRLAPGELIQAVCLPRRFSGYVHHTRKIGARNAQAISKVCIAALGRVANDTVEDVRIALASVAPVPLRLYETERVVRGKPIDETLVALAKKTAATEIKPLDDIRSTSKYRAAVAGNLIAEFLDLLSTGGNVSNVLALWNDVSMDAAVTQILPCCGSKTWAQEMARQRPFHHEAVLQAASDEIWVNLNHSDWMEAFRSHPRIGESASHVPADEKSAAWATQEQKKVTDADGAVKIALAEKNREYENKFGHTFIVCATGKSAFEMLEILQRRMRSDDETELREAAEQQRQITQIRLKKWLQE